MSLQPAVAILGSFLGEYFSIPTSLSFLGEYFSIPTSPRVTKAPMEVLGLDKDKLGQYSAKNRYVVITNYA